MRTGIYVYKPQHLTLEGSDELVVTSFDGQTSAKLPKVGAVEVPAGIYKVISASTITVTGDGVDVVTRNDKDPWPDPPSVVTRIFGVTAGALRAFFTDAKSLAL